MGRVFCAGTECADVREANINVVDNWWMPVLLDLNERAISLVEVRKEVN